MWPGEEREETSPLVFSWSGAGNEREKLVGVVESLKGEGKGGVSGGAWLLTETWERGSCAWVWICCMEL